MRLGDLSLSIFSGSLTASNLSIADDPGFGSAAFLTAKSFRIGVEMWPLITSQTLNITDLMIEKPELNLVRNQQGQWNFSNLGGSASTQPKSASTAAQGVPDFHVAKLVLKDRRATVTSGASKPSVYEHVDWEASDASYKSQFPVQVSTDLPGGAKFNLVGRIRPAKTTDSSLTPGSVQELRKAITLFGVPEFQSA